MNGYAVLSYRPTLRDRLKRALLGRNDLGPPEGAGYTVRVAEGDRFLEWRHIEDPFITTTLAPTGWRVALAVLLHLYVVEVRVSADRALAEQVMELNPNYLGPPGSKSRVAWDASLQQSLSDL